MHRDAFDIDSNLVISLSCLPEGDARRTRHQQAFHRSEENTRMQTLVTDRQRLLTSIIRTQNAPVSRSNKFKNLSPPWTMMTWNIYKCVISSFRQNTQMKFHENIIAEAIRFSTRSMGLDFNGDPPIWKLWAPTPFDFCCHERSRDYSVWNDARIV